MKEYKKKKLPRLIQGSGGGGKSGGASHVASEASDSLRSKDYAHIVDLLSEGEIEGIVGGMQGIYLNSVPLQNSDGSYNFSGVSVETRNGTLSQSRMTIATSAESTQAIGTELRHGVGLETSITDPNVDFARVTISVPQLTYQNPSTGDITGSSVQFQIEVKDSLTSYTQVPLGTTVATVGTNQASASGITGTSLITGSAQFQSSATYFTTPKGYTNARLNTNTFTLQYRVDGGAWQTLWTDKIRGAATIPWSLNASPASAYDFQILISGPNGDAKQYSGVFQFIQKTIPSSTVTISGKTTSLYEKQLAVPLAGTAPFTIRVTRLSEDATTSNVQDKIYLASITSVVNDKLRYPGSALVGISVDASQFSAIPTRAYDTKLLKVKVPSNYDPIERTYTGFWDGQFQVLWTDNPAWCFYDLLTSSRYGVGDRIDPNLIDKWALYTIAQYCDELVPDGFGGMEPRFTCNLYLQTREEAYKVLMDMAAIFRSMIYWSTGGVIAVQDSPKDPVYQFTNANVVEGTFNYQSANVQNRYNVALVSWNDIKQLGKSQVEYVEDAASIAKYGFINEVSITAFGCSSRGQARRLGKWLLYTNSLEEDSIAFDVGLDGAIPRPGDIIKVADTLRAGERRGGRIVSGDENSVTLDAPFTFNSGTTYTLGIINTEGALEECTLESLVGPNTSVAPLTPFMTPPSKNSIYVISSTDVEPQLFRVVSISEKEPGRYQIAAVTYNESKFDFIEDGEALEIPNISAIPNGSPVNPLNLNASDEVYRSSAKTFVSRITASWSAVSFTRGYILSYRELNGNWTSLQETKELSASVDNVHDGAQYELKVQAINSFGQTSSSPTSIFYTPLGLLRPPADVAGFTAVTDQQAGVYLQWTSVVDIDVDTYEIREGASWESSNLTAQVKGTQLTIGFPTNKTYFIKAVNVAGIYSTNVASLSVSVTLPVAPTVTYSFAGKNVVLSWNNVPGSYGVDTYEVSAPSLTTQTVKGTTLTVNVSWTGNIIFSVRAKDLGGNYGPYGTVTVSVGTAAAPIVAYAVEGPNVVLSWNAVQGSLPTSVYNIYLNGGLKTSIQGTSYSEKVSYSSGTYAVAAVDANGNIGAQGSVVVAITSPVAPSITQQVIDNNVLLKWTDSTRTLPISTYQIRRGSTWAGATVVGTSQSTFSAIFESAGGSYTYWIAGIDSAGNVGTPGSIGATVNQPPDYLMMYDDNSTFNGTFSNAFLDTVTWSVMMPVNTTETFQQHFTNHSWSTPQNQIDAAYPYFIEPTLASGYYEETIDYGTILAGTKITVTPTTQIISGTPVYTVQISVKTNSGDAWTDYPNTSSLYATNFRYVKVRITCTESDGKGVLALQALNIKLDEKLLNDAGTVTASASDSTGTVVYFNVAFIDVTSITLTPQGTSAVIPVYDFVDAPNPTQFKVYLFDRNGNRVSGTVSWNAKGV